MPILKSIIDATKLFPSDLLDDMMAGYFAGNKTGYWLTYVHKHPVAIAYAVPEPMTMGT